MVLWGWFKGRGRTVGDLARSIDVPAETLRHIRPQYREAEIPKRGGGVRRLLIPEPELKDIQRRIHRRVLPRLKAHPAATGFEKGHSIVSHAAFHTGRAVVLTMDIKDFFTATDARRVERYFKRIGWNREASRLLAYLCTHNGGLPQGAPTSPRLSNLVNAPLDAYLSRVAQIRGAVYSRYADDIVFSFAEHLPRDVHQVIRAVKRALSHHGYEAHLHKKPRIRRQHQRRVVTGLVVNRRPRLARKTRRWLRAVEHRRQNGKSITLSDAQLAGWQALAAMIDSQGAIVFRQLKEVE